MSAHDRPFPPGGLPHEASRVFRYAYELGYRQECVVEKHAEGGEGTVTARRKLGDFEIMVEHHLTVPGNIARWWVMIWYEGELVYDAWCSLVAATREAVGLVVTYKPGAWRAHLRRRAEREEKT